MTDEHNSVIFMEVCMSESEEVTLARIHEAANKRIS